MRVKSVGGDEDGGGVGKATLLKSLDVEKAHVKKVAAIVFKKQPKVLALFQARAESARRGERRRRPPAPPAAPKS